MGFLFDFFLKNINIQIRLKIERILKISREFGGRIKPNKREVSQLVSKLGGYFKVCDILSGRLEVVVMTPDEFEQYKNKKQSATEM